MSHNLEPRVIDVNELARQLGLTVPAVHAHLARKNFSAVPPPFKLGRRLAWSVEEIHKWLRAKMVNADQK